MKESFELEDMKQSLIKEKRDYALRTEKGEQRMEDRDRKLSVGFRHE